MQHLHKMCCKEQKRVHGVIMLNNITQEFSVVPQMYCTTDVQFSCKNVHIVVEWIHCRFSGRFIPNVTNGLSKPYHLDKSTFICRGIRRNFSFLFHFSMIFMPANRKASDRMPRFVASHLGLFCLTMSHKQAARLIWVK